MFQQRPLVTSRWKFEETSDTSPVTTAGRVRAPATG